MAGVECSNLEPIEVIGACERALGNVDHERISMLCGPVSRPFSRWVCCASRVLARRWVLLSTARTSSVLEWYCRNDGTTPTKTKALEVFPRNALSHVDYKGVAVMRTPRVRWIACGKLEVLEKRPPID